jgi:hypothetical protein
MSPLLWYLPFMIMSGACDTIYRTEEERPNHMDEDEPRISNRVASDSQYSDKIWG